MSFIFCSTMKFSTFLKQYLLLSLCSVSVLEAELLIPGEDGGPHANKVMVFDGSLNFWANDLYGFQAGKEVVFENAGTVTLGDMVAPKSVLVKGDGVTVWNGMGQITGETSVVKEGSGTLEINAVNSHTGGTQIKSGTVKAGGIGSFGSGVIELTGGVLDLGGFEINNEIQLSGGKLTGAVSISNQLIFKTGYDIRHNIAARGIQIEDGLQLSVAAGATLTVEEELELKKDRALDLSDGGGFRGKLLVEADGILKLSTKGSTPIAAGSTWHLNGASVSGNLSTAQIIKTAARTSTAGSTLRISGNSRINGALTLNGGSLQFSDAAATLHADTVVLSNATTLHLNTAPTVGNSQTFLTYNRLLSGNVTDYYDFFGINSEEYELTVNAQSMSLSPAKPIQQQETPPAVESIPSADSPTADEPDTTPVAPPGGNPTDDDESLPDAPTNPGPIIPGADDNDNSDSSDTERPNTPDTDDPHAPVIDTSGDTPDDPHNNKDTETEDDNSGEADADTILSPECGTALSQASMQSAWGSLFASHAFMNAVRDNSRSMESTTWAAFYGGLMECADDGHVPGGEVSAYGLAIGAAAHPGQRTQLGLALGASLGSINGESFGELDQMSLHAAGYFRHSFLKDDSRYHLRLYGAFGVGRTETDPGMYSGLENWHHNSVMTQTRLSWGMRLSQSVIWEIYGGTDYYRGSDLRADDEEIRGITNLRGSIGSGIAMVTEQATLYAEAEFNGDTVRDNPTATINGNTYRTAEPNRCGFTLRCGVRLQPQDSQRSIHLNYAFESRNNTSAHVISAGFTKIF